MTITNTTLRPGLLVSLKTTVTGNVNYTKQTIEGPHIVKGVGEKAKWETERTISDPVEFEAARVARTKVIVLVRSVCAYSAFGLLCPDDKVPTLENVIKEARGVADTFNAKAKLSRIGVYVMTGRIAPDDVEAVRAINSEVRGLLEDMAEGVKNLDAKVIREAANKARGLGSMLTTQAQERIQGAIESARTAARKIVKAGETAAGEVDKGALKILKESRMAFLDLESNGKEVAKVKTQSRAIDLTPAKAAAPKAPKKSTSRQLDMN